MSSTHTPGEESPDDDEIFPFIVDATSDRGQHIFCKNLLLNLFEPGISPCKTEFPDVKIKRQIIDHYLKDICNITQQYGIYSIEFTSPNHNNRKYTIQTDDLDLEFSKVFSEYIKSIQYHNSQRANSIFTNEVFAIIYSYISILENEIPITNVSPTETSKHLKVRHEITLLSSYLNIIKENFTKDDVSQHTKHDLQKILAWFIIDYFTHNIDLIAQARKNFRPQNSNDDTAITEQSDYVWDPEWSHPASINFPQSISSQAISTISYVRDYVRVIPLTIDATPLNYNTFLPDTQNNSLNSTVIHNENLNGTRNLTQQDIQTPSHFINEEIVHTTTTQQSISPIRPNLTTPRNTNPSQTQVTLQSTVKPSVAPKYSHMDYQTYRPMTIPSKTRKTFTRNNFTDHNYNYTHPSKTYNQPQRNFNQYTRSRNWDNPMTQPNSINFQTNPPQDHSENYPFFQQNKNKKQTSYQMDYLSSDDDFLQPDIFAPNTQEYRRQGIQKTRTNHRNFSPQPIDAQHQQPIQQQNLINTQSFQPIQQQNPMTAHSYQASQMQNEIPLPYYLQQHEITRNQLSNFSQMPNAAESLQMTMNPYLMGGSSITSNKPLMVFTGTDPEYSVEDYLNAVTANLILNIGPEPINTPLHQNWIHRRTALIQTTLDGAAQKWFSVLPLEIKSNWKRFTQEFSKMFDSERNKQQQRVLCNEIRRLPNETIKQIAVRIETLVRKAYSLNTHDYKNTKMTEILMMTLTPQLRKIAIKKRASHPSSIREPDLDFRKLVDKLEQAEITMKLEETENLKLQYVNRIETTPTNINNIQESETDLVEKITEILNIYEKNPNFKGKPSFKKWCNYCRRYGHSISECRQKQQDNQNKPQKYKEPNKSFYQYMKKDQNLPNKTVYSNNSSGKPLPNNTNYTRNQSPYNSSYRGRSPERRNTNNSSQNHYNRPNSRNNYSRSNSNTQRFVSNTNHIYQNIQKEQPKEKIWTIPFLLESPKSKEFQPPDLEIDFLIDSGAESNIINIPTWNEIKTLHPKLTPLETSSKLATAQGSTLINYGKIQLFLLPTRTMEQNKILTKPFKQIFHITDIKHNIIGIPFISKYIPTINILNSKILIKDKYTKTKDTSLTFFQRLNKQPPFFSKFYPIFNQQRKHLKPLSGNIYNFSIKQVHQYDKEQNKQKFYMSEFEFKPIHKFFKITISSIKYLKNSNSDIISLHVYNNTPYQVTLPLGLLGYCETNATISPIHEKAYRVNNILQLLDICQSTILNEELSINNIISNENRNTDYFTKTPYSKPTFNISNYTEDQQKFLTMFNFQHSQITQDEFEKLAKQLIKYSSVYATSKFDVGKISSSLHLPLKPDAVFKKQRASKVPIHLHDKVNRLLDILEQYNIISPVNKEEQPKGNTFINPVIILAKGESLKIVLDARYLNSLIDESKCNWPIEPIQVILTKINGKYFTTADMNSAYNQMPLDEQSRRLTQFVIGNQQYEFNRLFYGISIGPAAFSAFMSKIFRPLILKKNAITYLDDVFMQSQTKDEMFNVLEKYHQILQNENLKAAPDKSHFFLTRVKFLGHNIERKTITPLKSRIDAIQKLQPPTNKKKIQEFLGMLNFLSKYVYKMQLYLRPFYNILRQQNNFEWNTEHQTRFEEIKKLLTEQISNTIPDSNQPFYAMCDASNFGIGAALLQSHNGTNKMNLISANSRLFTQAELRLSTLMRECTAIIYTLTEYEFLILGSKHPTVLFTDHKPIIFLFTQKSNPNHRVYRFQLILMKFPNLHIVWTAGKNLALPDTLSRNTPPELLTRKTTVEIPKNIKFYLAENETSPRLECKYAVKTDIEQSQINSLQHFPLYLDCQNNHYEVDLLGTSTFKPIPYSQWIKNNTQQKRTKQHLPKKDHFPLIEKEDLTDKINLSGPQTNDSKYTINQVFDLHDPLDTIPLSKLEIENIFLPPTETITISTLKQYQNLDPVIRQLKSWHKYKTKPIKADSTILGNKTLLRYFRKFNNTTINENTDLLEYNLNESTVPCLPLSMILIAFNISHTQNIKGHSGSEKTYSNFIQNFYFPNAPIWIKVLCNDCIVCQLNKPYPNQKQIAQKQDFKGQSLYFNHRISFDTKGPISPSSEGNSYIMVIVDAFTHYVALNPVPHCNAYYAYTTLYEHWIAKFGLPEILVTDNGTEFINNEIITLCHLYNIKHKPRTSHAPWTNGLVEGMNRSLQEYLRCIINGNDTKYTEWSADVKLFPLAYNSQITTTLGMSPYEMVFNQKPRKPIMFTANSHKNAQGYCQPNKDSICYNLPLHTHDEDHFHHPQILKLASGTHTEWILNRDKKHNEIYQKITKKLLQRQNINEQINSRFTPASELKIGTFVLIPNFNTQKGISKKLQPLRKGPYQIIAKPTDVTYKITDSNKKEIVQHRNNLLPYYPKEYALRELTQLYSFTGLKIIQNEPHLKNTEQNDNPTENQNTKPTATKNNTQNHKESPKQRKNRKMTEQIIPQEQIDKSENRKTTRLRNQPRKNYKIFIPQSKILKKVEFQK